jgi:hypothetical protein
MAPATGGVLASTWTLPDGAACTGRAVPSRPRINSSAANDPAILLFFDDEVDPAQPTSLPLHLRAHWRRHCSPTKTVKPVCSTAAVEAVTTQRLVSHRYVPGGRDPFSPSQRDVCHDWMVRPRLASHGDLGTGCVTWQFLSGTSSCRGPVPVGAATHFQ